MKELKKKCELLASLATISILSAANAHAGDGWQLPQKPEGLPDSFEGSITNITDWLLGFIGLLSILVIVYGGVVYVGSTGDQERVTSAKKTIKYALMGLIVAGIAYAAVNTIINNLH